MTNISPSGRYPGVSGFFTKQLPILLLLAVIALGSYARLKHSGDTPLCMDESWRISCLLDAADLSEQLLVGMNRTDPLFFNLLIYTLGQLYNTEFVLRLAAIIPGILALPLAWLVGRRLFGNRWLALLASFLTAFSLEIMVFSKELKPYSLCALVHLGLLYGYLRYRKKITVRSTVVFTALLALSVPLSLHSSFAFPGIYLALFAGTLFEGTVKQRRLVLASCAVLLVLSSLCFFMLFGNVEDESHLDYIKGYWAKYFPPTDSMSAMAAWVAPRYIDHYTDIAYANELAPELIAGHLHLIYPSMSLLGFLALLLRDRRRFIEAFCLFVLPIVVLFLFSLLNLWPFGRERMNLFVFFYILFPPLFFLDELGKISLNLTRLGRIKLQAAATLIVCALMLIQFPWDFRSFAGQRVVGCWQSSAQALEHLLDIYPNGPQLPLVINYLGQAQFNYYSKYHRRTAERYRRQADLFAPRGLPTRNSGFYLRSAMLRLLQEHRQVAVYMTHYLGPESMIFNNDFCVEHDGEAGNKSYSCLITSEIYDAAKTRQQILLNRRFTGASGTWQEVYCSPLLELEDARPGALVIFNLDLDFHGEGKQLRLDFRDQDGTAVNFHRAEDDYENPVDEDHLEAAAYIKLLAPVEQISVSISARDSYDFTVSDFSWFVSRSGTWNGSGEPLRFAEDICERIRLLRAIRELHNFWDDQMDGLGWTNGTSRIELDQWSVDPRNQVFLLETHGRMLPEIREKVIDRSLKIYFNHKHRAPLIRKDGDPATRYWFQIPAEARTVNTITIKSRTFVPRDLGLNDDTRSLGVDIKAIGFPWIVGREDG